MTGSNIVSKEGIIDQIFEKFSSQNYTVAYPIMNSEYDEALNALKKELKAEIESKIKLMVDMDDGKNKYQTIVNRGSINALKWLVGTRQSKESRL